MWSSVEWTPKHCNASAEQESKHFEAVHSAMALLAGRIYAVRGDGLQCGGAGSVLGFSPCSALHWHHGPGAHSPSPGAPPPPPPPGGPPPPTISLKFSAIFPEIFSHLSTPDPKNCSQTHTSYFTNIVMFQQSLFLTSSESTCPSLALQNDIFLIQK